MTRVCTIFIGLLACAVAQAGTITITFETLGEGDVAVNQFLPLGVAFSGDPVVWTAGSLLNEFDFPPHSGVNVLVDVGGPITLTFAQPVSSVSAYFTYTTPLTLQAFDTMGAPAQTQMSSASSNLGADELIGFTSALDSIGSLMITGDPGGMSFTMDDLTFGSLSAAVPEPATLFLAGSAALVAVLILRGKKSATKCVPAGPASESWTRI